MGWGIWKLPSYFKNTKRINAMYVTKSLLASRKSTGNKSLHCTFWVDGYARETGLGFSVPNAETVGLPITNEHNIGWG